MTGTNDIEVLSINIIGISVTSIYKPLMTIFNIQPDVNNGHINVVIGDFNAETNKDGDLLENWSDTNQLSLINNARCKIKYKCIRFILLKR